MTRPDLGTRLVLFLALGLTVAHTAVAQTVQPPTGLFASSVTGNLVTLRWTPPSLGPTPTNYVLEGGLMPGQVLGSLPTGTVSPTFTFPAPTGSFYLRAHALDGASRSAASNEILVHVNVPVVPSPPANLLGLVNGSTLALAWTNTYAGGAPTNVTLDVSGAVTGSAPLGLTDSFTFAGVPPGTYTFSVTATNAGGSSVASNPVRLTFPAACSGAPQTVANFLAYQMGGTLFVNWDAPATGTAPTGYVLNVNGSYVGSILTPLKALSGAVPPGTYTFTVAATNACGASAATGAQTVTISDLTMNVQISSTSVGLNGSPVYISGAVMNHTGVVQAELGLQSWISQGGITIAAGGSLLVPVGWSGDRSLLGVVPPLSTLVLSPNHQANAGFGIAAGMIPGSAVLTINLFRFVGGTQTVIDTRSLSVNLR